MMKAGSILTLVLLGSVTLMAAETPLERLGRTTQWFLMFINDPYSVREPTIEALEPFQAAKAIADNIGLPMDGDLAETTLVERYNGIQASALPKSLRSFVDRAFKAWRKTASQPRLELSIASGRPAEGVATPWRVDRTVFLPVPTIGRDVVRSVRDRTLFKHFMWAFTHPQWASARPSARSPQLTLTGQCSLDPLKPVHKRCGGDTAFHQRRSDVDTEITHLEADLSRRLHATFDAAVTSPPAR